MSEHIKIQTMKSYWERSLKPGEIIAIVKHMEACSDCRRVYQEISQEMNVQHPISLILSTALMFKHEHLEYDQLVSLADKTLDEEDRQILDIHLQDCEGCRDDLRVFLEFRQQIDAAADLKFRPESHAKWAARFSGLFVRPNLKLRPLTIGMIAFAGSLFLLAIFLPHFGQKNVQGPLVSAPRITPPSPLPTHSPTTPPPAGISGVETKPPADEDIASLHDSEGRVVVTRGGIVRGLDAIPSDMQQAVKDALLRKELRKPALLKDLDGAQGSSRGAEDNKAVFKLIYPGRTVIPENRPLFRWQSIEGAVNYQVQVADSRGAKIAESETITSTSWTPAQSLQRGKFYTWSVTAILDGQQITSPAPTRPEMKFKVLDISKKRQIEELRKRSKSHLALGVFYAREGMIAEAEQEFQSLVRSNPDSPIAVSLLRAIQSW
jgi:hypothetical protein